MANTTGRKYGGRKTGTPNKDTSKLRERIELLLEDNWDKVLEDIEGLNPKERIDIYTRLLEYALPKLSRVEAKIDSDELQGQLQDLSSLTDEELEILSKISEKIESKNFHPVTIFELPDNGRN
jgi:hypothetical protein